MSRTVELASRDTFRPNQGSSRTATLGTHQLSFPICLSVSVTLSPDRRPTLHHFLPAAERADEGVMHFGFLFFGAGVPVL